MVNYLLINPNYRFLCTYSAPPFSATKKTTLHFDIIQCFYPERTGVAEIFDENQQCINSLRLLHALYSLR